MCSYFAFDPKDDDKLEAWRSAVLQEVKDIPRATSKFQRCLRTICDTVTGYSERFQRQQTVNLIILTLRAGRDVVHTDTA